MYQNNKGMRKRRHTLPLTSAIRSPSPIFSPSFFSQRAIVPVCMVGDRAGSSTCSAKDRSQELKNETRGSQLQHHIILTQALANNPGKISGGVAAVATQASPHCLAQYSDPHTAVLHHIFAVLRNHPMSCHIWLQVTPVGRPTQTEREKISALNYRDVITFKKGTPQLHT